jgi:hypothetical protein
MRKFSLILSGIILCSANAQSYAAVRSQSNPVSIRQVPKINSERINRSVSSRSATNNLVQRKTTARNASTKTVIGRTNIKSATNARNAKTTNISRAATNTVKTRTFDTNYNSCRDAYFTCMDQFCATQNETYRRCVCSSKLKNIQDQERLLSQTSDSLKDFESLNIDIVSKTSKEVKAMLSASDGESAIKKDTSESANTIQNISSVLSSSKQQSLSTQGKLDVAGDIKQIWSTTSLIGGSDIADLTGENLFNAVHAQCTEIVADSCKKSDLKMVASAYGMYVENDCAVLENNLKNKKITANSAIRQTRQKMQDARYENYNAHNSESINECIANVRQDLLANNACGQNYVHCLDFSGKYLNINTGEPIYSSEFYQIENQISLSGDVLKNSQNTSFVSALNKKRSFAKKDLDLCQDNADEVWNEFLRQAIVEIYQQQQERVKTVKEECLQVVNECYLKQSSQLKQLTNDSSKINPGQTLELSEEMCADKLDACSNLYGGSSEGLEILVATMTGITDATIEQSCSAQLMEFAKNICAVPDNDSLHAYPYGCRKYAPGESMYARKALCNETLVNPFSKSEILTTAKVSYANSLYTQMCINRAYTKKYISCKPNYYLYSSETTAYSKDAADLCMTCPPDSVCVGGQEAPTKLSGTTQELYNTCGEYYVGSLYQQFAIYALQNCRRPSDKTSILSENLIMEIDTALQSVRIQISAALSKECEIQNGQWVDVPWIDKNSDGVHDQNNDTLHTEFYVITGANTLWGYCKNSN